MIHRHHLMTALSVGVVLTYVALWAQPHIGNASVNFMMKGAALSFSAATVAKIAAQLCLVIPGLVAGWLAQTRGTPLALIAGIAGALLYEVSLGAALQAPAHPYLPNPWSWVIGNALAQGVIAGVSGGAGQLLRSNTSPERTRKR